MHLKRNIKSKHQYSVAIIIGELSIRVNVGSDHHSRSDNCRFSLAQGARFCVCFGRRYILLRIFYPIFRKYN